MNGSDRILSMVYIKETLLHPEHTLFVLVNQYPKTLKISRREYMNLKFSKKSLEKIEIICNVIQNRISLWKDEI